MQQFHVLTAAVLLLAGASTVFAASSVDLSVTGSITPSACTPELSNGGVVDHGKISLQDLHPYNDKQWPDATLTLSVNCDATALIAVKVMDNRHGTANGSQWTTSTFGLGLTSSGKKIGRYILTMANATADGVARGLIESIDGKTWLDAWDAAWQPSWMRTVNAGSSQFPAPLPLQTFQTDLVISTWLSGRSNLPVSEETPIDGSATLDIVYL
ncbi:hypothetical protein BFW86_04550 [Pseudomonas fluorescens]|nr:hypothetical protein BFW86_04550 [Pseudomonas fluorescens]